MTKRVEDFATEEEAYEYAAQRLEVINERIKDLEHDMISLASNPPFEEVQKTAKKWQERAADLQEAKT